MRRLILMVAVVFAIVATSCKKKHKHGPETHEHDSEKVEQDSQNSEKVDIAMADTYQCPMDCEKGKTYAKESACPTCKMNLKKVEEKKDDGDEGHKEDHDAKKKHDHDGHSH